MTSPWIEFDWDPAKASANAAKHRVSFDEAMTIFADPLALTIADPDTVIEERWITIGLSLPSRLLLVVHTHVALDDDHTYIRIISARRPTGRERRHYEHQP